MKQLITISAVAILAASCHFNQKAKEAVNKTGETVAKAGSEFVDGVSKGIQESFQSEVKFSDELVKKGIKAGKISIEGTDSTTDNILRVYFIFDADFNQPVQLKAYTQDNLEYGRTSQTVHGKKGDAGYVDFIFDKRTNLDNKSRFTFE